MDPLKEYLRKNRSRFIEELCTYLRFPSISAEPRFKRELNACAKWISQHCREFGLETKVHSTDGHPIVTARTPRARGGTKPHYLVYGHYDVQPVEPLNLWRSQPFHPRKVGPSLFARGASDNKGQHFAHLKALEAYRKTGTELPCEITFLIEGEEEVGSPSLSKFLRKNRRELNVDAVIISDTTLRSLHHPTLSYALRGICGLEILVSGPSRDLHSGIFGGAVDNPAMVLCQMLAKLRDKNGRIAIPGFYQDVIELTPFERAQLALQPFETEEYKRFLGVPQLFGEVGFSPVEQCSSRPTLEINGFTSGHQGIGGKTIVPAWARAKLTMRLVPRQQPEKIQTLVAEHLKKICPPTVRLKITSESGGAPYYLSPENEKVDAALDALREAFDCEPILVREGGSIPIVNEFKEVLGADSLLLGLALPDDNAHSPNEKFDLRAFDKGMRLSALLWQKLARIDSKKYNQKNLLKLTQHT